MSDGRLDPLPLGGRCHGCKLDVFLMKVKLEQPKASGCVVETGRFQCARLTVLVSKLPECRDRVQGAENRIRDS